MACLGGLGVGAVSQTGRLPDGRAEPVPARRVRHAGHAVWPLIQAIEVLEERWQRWLRGLPLGANRRSATSCRSDGLMTAGEPPTGADGATPAEVPGHSMAVA